MRLLSLRFFAVIALTISPLRLVAGDAGRTAQPYEKIRYPTFKDGRLHSLLEADRAEAFDMAEGTPRIDLNNVRITLYNLKSESVETLPDDEPAPIEMIITSDRGFLVRRPPEPNVEPEDIANLEGNVILRQMRNSSGPLPANLRPRRLDASIETEIRCQHAQWNNSQKKLVGDGEVEFLQEDSRIIGTGFMYLADDEAVGTGPGISGARDWGGIIFIEHNARMEIDRSEASGVVTRTEIVCKDTASYKLREREIQFEREVKIRRPGLTIEADIVKVFLRLEDDLRSETEASDQQPLPGQVKTIVATIGNRPGSVVITGFETDLTGMEVFQYAAKGGRADYNFDANNITLTDNRTERVPEVEFEQDRISDRRLDFVMAESGLAKNNGKMTLETLNASGGQGQVMLRPRSATGGEAVATEVSYKGNMSYSRSDGRIRFRGSVFLKQGDLRIRSEILEARLPQDAQFMVPGRIHRIIAENDVSIQAGDREARAQRAEYDMNAMPHPTDPGREISLYTLRLFGFPQRTPPHPWVRDELGNQISAPEIHMQRLEQALETVDRGGTGGERHLIYATGGTAVCDFYTTPRNLTEEGKLISIKCEKGMEYNEATGVAWFDGQVMATSDAPEDNYVLTCDRLILNLPEIPDANDPRKRIVRIRRIDADGNARLMQDVRICEANRIIRDFPTERLDEGDIYLEGAPAGNNRPAQMAVYREQNGAQVGSMFAAPRIMASARGDLIRANGPGQLSMPDEIPGFRSEIHFDGAALYEAPDDGVVSLAKFRRGVFLRQPSRNLTINSEEMDATFLRDDDLGPVAGDGISIERVGRLRRVEGRVGVKVEHALPRQGKRVAIGDRGVVEFTPNGNVLTLQADRQQDNRRFVMARDHDGLTLRAPEIEVREAQGVTRASGPGDLQIPGNASGEGMARVPTRVIFGERGQMVYNELAMNIRVSDNVRIIQPGAGNNWSFPSLDGRCDRMDIILMEPPIAGMSGPDAMSRVSRMDALGGVLLRVYADPPPDNPNIDWLSRPGLTFFTRGDHGVYHVQEGRIEVSSLPGRRPQLLLNTVDAGRPPFRQRFRAERFILNTASRRWTLEGQQEINTLRDGEAFEFVD